MQEPRRYSQSLGKARTPACSPAAGSSHNEVTNRCPMPHNQARCPPDRREPSHVYPTTSGRRRLLVASGCLGCRQVRDARASLSCTFHVVAGDGFEPS